MPGVPIPASSSPSALSGSITDEGWSVVWSESDGIYGANLDETATGFKSRFQVSNKPTQLTSTARCGSRLLVAWIDSLDSGGPLRMRELTNGVPQGDEQVVDDGPVRDLQLAGSSAGAVLIWSTKTEIRAMRFGPDGEAIDRAAIRVDSSRAEKGHVDVGASNGSYLVAWEEADNNPAYPCRFNQCAEVLEVRMVASLLEPFGAGPSVTLKSYDPIAYLDYRGPYTHGFGWSPRSGLLLWDDYSALLMIPISEELQPSAPLVVVDSGISNTQFDGRNFVVCSYRGNSGSTLFVVSQFGNSFVNTGIAVPYGHLVAGINGKTLLIWTSSEVVPHTYAALVVDDAKFPQERHRAARH